jgi:hypothetical protein
VKAYNFATRQMTATKFDVWRDVMTMINCVIFGFDMLRDFLSADRDLTIDLSHWKFTLPVLQCIVILSRNVTADMHFLTVIFTLFLNLFFRLRTY